jgi:hypothetical protein
MQTWDEIQLGGLQASYPDWELWIVRCAVPPHTVWCARPKGAPIATINVYSPEELITAIADRGSAP